MTDTELLILAAKAAGYKVSNRLVGGGLMIMSKERQSPHKWNPRDDDGDALRLLSFLGMDLTQTSECVSVPDVGVTIKIDSEGRASSIRLAITTAAAIAASGKVVLSNGDVLK